MSEGYYACPWYDCRLVFEDRSALSDHLDIHLETFHPVKREELSQWRMIHMGGPTPTLGTSYCFLPTSLYQHWCYHSDSLLDVSTQALTQQSDDVMPVAQPLVDNSFVAPASRDDNISPPTTTTTRFDGAESSGLPELIVEKPVDIPPEHSNSLLSSPRSITGDLGSSVLPGHHPGTNKKETLVSISQARCVSLFLYTVTLPSRARTCF